MRSVLIVSLVVCLSMVAGMANAASPGQVPDATLAAFGLGGMQQMTDAQGTDIRGMGFAAVSGAEVVGKSVNGYLAVSSPRHGSALAAGAAVTIVASGVGVFPSSGSPSGFVVGTIAVGGAVAYAK